MVSRRRRTRRPPRDATKRSSRRRPAPDVAVVGGAEPRRVLRRWCPSTGWTSVGELLMTRRISLVAVCCSSVSVRSRLRAWSSGKRRTFSMAMTAWSANRRSSSRCLSEKGSTTPRNRAIAPSGAPSRRSGVATMVRCPKRRWNSRPSGNSSSGSAAKSWTCTGPPIDDGSAGHRSPGQRELERRRHLSADDCLAEPSHPRRAAERLTLEPKEQDVGRSAEARGGADHRVEDRLDVGRGARDRPQDLGGGRLLLEGLRQLLIARL